MRWDGQAGARSGVVCAPDTIIGAKASLSGGQVARTPVSLIMQEQHRETSTRANGIVTTLNKEPVPVPPPGVEPDYRLGRHTDDAAAS